MTKPNPEDFAYLLRMLETAFSQKIEPETADMYYRQLREKPRIVLLRTFEYLSNTAKFFPRLAEINQAIMKFDGVYLQPDGEYSAFDEATIWRLNMIEKKSTAELNQMDIQEIYVDMAKHGYKIAEREIEVNHAKNQSRVEDLRNSAV